MNFTDVVLHCAANEALVNEFNRLTGSQLGRSLQRSHMDRMIDDACGLSGEDDQDMAKFTAFVLEYIWLPLEEVMQ